MRYFEVSYSKMPGKAGHFCLGARYEMTGRERPILLKKSVSERAAFRQLKIAQF